MPGRGHPRAGRERDARAVLVFFGLATATYASGCATVFTTLMGAALCGRAQQSAQCMAGATRAGLAVDAAILEHVERGGPRPAPAQRVEVRTFSCGSAVYRAPSRIEARTACVDARLARGMPVETSDCRCWEGAPIADAARDADPERARVASPSVPLDVDAPIANQSVLARELDLASVVVPPPPRPHRCVDPGGRLVVELDVAGAHEARAACAARLGLPQDDARRIELACRCEPVGP